MRTSSKSYSIYEDLRADIAEGRLRAGVRLPRESELCQRLGVARETLRRALARLEKEKLIERRRSLGTFVRDAAETPISLTFLLPCPDYLSRRGGMPAFNRSIFEGVLTECFGRNGRVTTLPVSPDNRHDHIDVRQLDPLGPDSRVIVQSPWFAPLFPRLEQIGCRVVYVTGGVFNRADEHLSYPQYPARAKKIVFDLHYAFELAATKLLQAGCRRIAVAAPYLDEPENYPRSGYLAALARRPGAEPLTLALDDPCENADRLRGELRAWHGRTGFDGLVLCPLVDDEPASGGYTHESLGLPEDVKVVLTWLLPGRAQTASPLPAVTFDAPGIGAQAADALLDPAFVANEVLAPPMYLAGSAPAPAMAMAAVR